MNRVIIHRVFAVTVFLAISTHTIPVTAQQLPPGITLEQLNKLTPQQRAEIIRRLQEAQTATMLSTGELAQMQLPESLIPQPDTTRAITRVDTTQFYVESSFDFGLVEGEFDSTAVLELYGRRLFQLAPAIFEPSTYGPVGSEYQLGPGDEVIITVWGAYQNVYELTVNREGYVLVPGVGQVVLAYLTLEQAKRRLYQYLTPSHQALNFGREGATAFLDVSLGKLRAIKVFVLGDALRPGAYTLSSVSTIFTALYAAGGPSNLGSLRVIRLIRGSREIARLDGYDNLLRGDPSNDVRLEDNDIVFINPIGPKVMVQGRVQRPAVYELKSGETLKDIIDASGGITASARIDRTQIARILPPAERGSSPWVRVFIDINLGRFLSESDLMFPLVDGDVITIFPVPDDMRDFIVVEGAVWNEGRLQWTEDITIRDAINSSGGLREEVLLSRVEVIRTNPDETTIQISKNLERAMNDDPDENLILERRDRVHIFSIHDIFPQKNVHIYGQVRQPGEYILHQSMTVMDLIMRAGGFTKDAWTVSAEVVRMHRAEDGSVADFVITMVPIDTTYAPRGPSSFLLEDFDQVFVRQRPKWVIQRNVELRGEVLFPGPYSLQRDDETVAELIKRAGGLSQYAYAEGARFYRKFEDAGRINLNLKEALDRPNSLNNLVMQPGDSLYVPPRVEFVTIRGEVGYPSSVLYVRGKGPGYYINQAGGYAEMADKKRTRVTLPNGSTWQPRWFFIPDPDVEPGSVIFIPAKAESERNTWEVIRDTAALLTSFTTVLLLIWQISR